MLGGVDAWVPKYVAVTQDLPDGTSAYRSFEFPDKTEMNKKLMSIHLKDFTTERPKRGADFVTATVKKNRRACKIRCEFRRSRRPCASQKELGRKIQGIRD